MVPRTFPVPANPSFAARHRWLAQSLSEQARHTRRRHVRAATLGALLTAMARLQRTIQTWRARAVSRRQLGELSDHLLRDIGLTRHEARVESSKPFWTA